MTIDELRIIHGKRPFQPIRVHLADERKLEVRHSEFMFVPPTRQARTFVIVNDRGLMEWFNILLVTSVEQFNGSQRRRKSA